MHNRKSKWMIISKSTLTDPQCCNQVWSWKIQRFTLFFGLNFILRQNNFPINEDSFRSRCRKTKIKKANSFQKWISFEKIAKQTSLSETAIKFQKIISRIVSKNFTSWTSWVIKQSVNTTLWTWQIPRWKFWDFDFWR